MMICIKVTEIWKFWLNSAYLVLHFTIYVILKQNDIVIYCLSWFLVFTVDSVRERKCCQTWRSCTESNTKCPCFLFDTSQRFLWVWLWKFHFSVSVKVSSIFRLQPGLVASPFKHDEWLVLFSQTTKHLLQFNNKKWCFFSLLINNFTVAPWHIRYRKLKTKWRALTQWRNGNIVHS